MASTILGLRAETSIHAGTGQNTGVIDLPIQREAHTGWPCVFGSAMKGALRARAESGAGDPDWVKPVFGPDTKNASEHAGAIAVTDARLLLLPVRSLTGHFRWVTCPAVLKRLKRDTSLVGGGEAVTVPDVPKEKVVSSKGGDPLFLEEFQFGQQQADLGAVLDLLAAFGIERDELEERLVIMGDDDFADFCGTATAITPHIAIDNEKKAVVPGALWYEESLPPDTLLYTMLMASPAREKGSDMTAEEVREAVTGLFKDRPYLQIGGNETVGMGWCRVAEVRA